MSQMDTRPDEEGMKTLANCSSVSLDYSLRESTGTVEVFPRIGEAFSTVHQVPCSKNTTTTAS